MRRTQEEHLIHIGNVDAFVENVDGEDVVERCPFPTDLSDRSRHDGLVRRQPLDGGFARALRIGARESERTKPPAVEGVRKRPRLLVRSAKDEALHARAAPTVKRRFPKDVVDAFLTGEPREVGEFARFPRIRQKFPNAEVVEGTEELFFERALKAKLIRNVVIEQRIDVFAVRSVGTCRHAEPEARFEVAHDAQIACSRSAVHFVDDDEVETLG